MQLGTLVLHESQEINAFQALARLVECTHASVLLPDGPHHQERKHVNSAQILVPKETHALPPERQTFANHCQAVVDNTHANVALVGWLHAGHKYANIVIILVRMEILAAIAWMETMLACSATRHSQVQVQFLGLR